MAILSSPTAKGQGLLEYALIITLVAVVVIAALTLLGPGISAVYAEANGLFPVAAGSTEPPAPELTEEPFGFASESEAKTVFCTTYTGTDHFHVHYNSSTGRYIGLPNLTTSPVGFSLMPPSYCP